MSNQNCQMSLEFDDNNELGLELELELEPASPAHNLQHSLDQPATQVRNEQLSVLSHRGKRSSNLDRFDWYVCETYQLYAVFDGHVTATVSDYLKQHLLPTIVSALSVGNDFAQAALHSFAQIEKEMLAFQSESEEFIGGSTAIVCMVAGNYVFTANLGDSRAILVSDQGELRPLSNTHTLDNPSEFNQVCSRGGLVIRYKNHYRLDGELSVSRSIGDAKYKNYLSATPEISIQRRAGADYLMLGSDGFWEEADQKIFRKMVRQSSANPAQTLYNSLRNRSRDNATVMCVKLIQ